MIHNTVSNIHFWEYYQSSVLHFKTNKYENSKVCIDYVCVPVFLYSPIISIKEIKRAVYPLSFNLKVKMCDQINDTVYHFSGPFSLLAILPIIPSRP
jgi:hypothetical protein